MKKRKFSSRAAQLASLTAAGAGAMALTSGTAEASIIESGILNQTIGFSSNLNPTGSNVVAASLILNSHSATGGPILKFEAISNKFSTGFYTRRLVLSPGGARNTSFAMKSGIDHFALGSGWGAITTNGVAALSFAARCFGQFAGTGGRPSFTDQYFLFRFTGNSGTEYGWIEASMSVTGSTSALSADGPSATIVQYAFDNTGAVIDAGQVPTPEPSTLVETGLAALILGAEGLRRWRKAARA